MTNSKTITVFGSSKPLPDEPNYIFSYELGMALAEAGYSIANGGYSGTMAGVSEGASGYPVDIVGVTCESFGRSSRNQWITKEICTHDLNERLMKLIELGDAYLALPGGTGTLLEISMAWEMLNKNFLVGKPLIAFGHSWRLLIDEIVQHDSKAAKYIYGVDTVGQALNILEKNIQS